MSLNNKLESRRHFVNIKQKQNVKHRDEQGVELKFKSISFALAVSRHDIEVKEPSAKVLKAFSFH